MVRHDPGLVLPAAAAAIALSSLPLEQPIFSFCPAAPPHAQLFPPSQHPLTTVNGYPQLPEETLQKRSPWGWWDQQERKNFEEVVHEEEDRLGMWGPDVHKVSGPKALGALALAAVIIYGFGQFISANTLDLRAARRTYPHNGLEKALGGSIGARKEEDDVEE